MSESEPDRDPSTNASNSLARYSLITALAGIVLAAFVYDHALRAELKQAAWATDPASPLALEDSKRDSRSVEQTSGPLALLVHQAGETLSTPSGQAGAVVASFGLIALAMFLVGQRLAERNSLE